MTELEMSLTLGIMIEPERNKVRVDSLMESEVMYLKHIFQIIDEQKQDIGVFNPDTWADLLPWHSLN